MVLLLTIVGEEIRRMNLGKESEGNNKSVS